jgi:phage tail sheath protein FI
MPLVIENTLPGVTVLVNDRLVGSPVKRQPTSTAFVVGYAPWGPVNVPTLVTSWQDYVRQFGGNDDNSFLDDFCHVFFNLFQGKQVYVCHVVGAAAAVATLTFVDRAVAPVNTLRVDGKYQSPFIIKAKVEAGTQANTVKLTFRCDALGVVEVYDNFKVDAASIEFVNQKSKIVKLTNSNSATAAPSNLPALSSVVNGVVQERALAGGTGDFAGLAAADYIGTDSGTTRTGLQVFKDEYLGTGQVAVPGITSDTVHAAITAHAEAYHRIGFIDPPLASDKQDVLDIRANYGTWYGALYWPWVLMLDHAGSGLKKFYPPSCFAAGACAQVDRTIGTHKAPANITIPNALDVERYSNGQTQVDDNTHEALNGKDINVIRPLPEQGIKIYGARVMTADRRIQFVHQIRLINLIYYSLKIAYASYVFAVVNDALFRTLASVARVFLRNLWKAGALFGEKEADAFVVICDRNNNPSDELDAGRVNEDVGVHLVDTAETIFTHLNNVPNSQDLSVLQQ